MNYQKLSDFSDDSFVDIVGYCSYCKEKIYSDEDFVRKSHNRIYHKECWEQKTDTREELHFEE